MERKQGLWSLWVPILLLIVANAELSWLYLLIVERLDYVAVGLRRSACLCHGAYCLWPAQHGSGKVPLIFHSANFVISVAFSIHCESPFLFFKLPYLEFTIIRAYPSVSSPLLFLYISSLSLPSPSFCPSLFRCLSFCLSQFLSLMISSVVLSRSFLFHSFTFLIPHSISRAKLSLIIVHVIINILFVLS